MSLKTLYRSIKYTTARHLIGRRRLVARAQSGARFAFQAADAVGRRLYKHGDYEPELSHFLLNWEPQTAKGLFVDVGANIGYYSVHMALKDIRTWAFEPDPLNYSLLTQNLQRNHCDNHGRTEAHQFALSDEKGTAAFYRYPEKNLGRHSLLPINEGTPIEVPTLIFDEFVEEKGVKAEEIEMIKIDVEGYEPKVLKGMQKTLSQGNPTIVAEFSPSLMKAGGLDMPGFLSFMLELGFGVEQITRTGLKKLEVKSLLEVLPYDEGTNLLWRK